jgi:hypothetical protein
MRRSGVYLMTNSKRKLILVNYPLDLVNDFKKPPEPDVFYIPIWSETELQKIAPLFPNAKDWGDRFKILGGIPRTVFESISQNPRH